MRSITSNWIMRSHISQHYSMPRVPFGKIVVVAPTPLSLSLPRPPLTFCSCFAAEFVVCRWVGQGSCIYSLSGMHKFHGLFPPYWTNTGTRIAINPPVHHQGSYYKMPVVESRQTKSWALCPPPGDFKWVEGCWNFGV